MPDTSPDSRLLPEQTRLSWRATTLALAGFTIAIAKLNFDAIGASALIPTFFIGAGFVWVVIVVRRRRRFTDLHEARFLSRLPDGQMPLAVTLIAGTLCVGELIATVLRALG